MEEEERDQREAKRVSIDGSRRFAPPRPAPAPAPTLDLPNCSHATPEARADRYILQSDLEKDQNL